MSIYAKFEPEACIRQGQWLETCLGEYKIVDTQTGNIVQEGKIVYPTCLKCDEYLSVGGYGDNGVILVCERCKK